MAIKRADIYVPTKDATASASDILYGQTAYAAGQKITGTYPTLQYTRVTLTSDQDIGTSYDVISWESEANDDFGAWAAGEPTRLTVPTGVTEVELVAYVCFANESTGTRQVKIVKNGSTTVYESTAHYPRNETGRYYTTGVLTVSATDYFEVYAAASSGSDVLSDDTWGGPCWFEMRLPFVPTNICIVGIDNTHNYASTWGDVYWEKKYIDKVGAWSSGNANRLTVPKGYTKARVWGLVSPLNANSYSYNVRINLNGAGNPIAFASAPMGKNGVYLETGWIATTATTYYTLAYLATDDFCDVLGDEAAWYGSRFGIELMP